MWHSLPQNFTYNTVLVPRSRRKIALTKLHAAPILWGYLMLFLNMRSIFTLTQVLTSEKKFYIQHFFQALMWSHFKNLIISNEGLQVNTLTRSYTYYSLKKYNCLLNSKVYKVTSIVTLSYLKPTYLIFNSFSKNVFNKLLTFSLSFIILPYFAFSNLVTLQYNYIFLSNSVFLLNFLNAFYFKVHVY